MIRRSKTSRSLMVAALLAAVGFTGCTLRPRYTELLQRAGVDRSTLQEDSTVAVRVVDPKTNAPIEGANVSFGEGKRKFKGRTDANGVVQVPAGAAYAKDNALVVIDLPVGVTGYRLEAAQAAAADAATAPAIEAPAAEATAPAESATMVTETSAAGTAPANGEAMAGPVSWRALGTGATLEPVAVEQVTIYTLREADKLPPGVTAAPQRVADPPEANVVLAPTTEASHQLVGVAELHGMLPTENAHQAIATEAAKHGANAVVFVEEGEADRFVAVALRLAK